MATPLPSCPNCDSASTLEAVAVESRGVRVCVCSCCASTVRVDADGAVVHRVTDVSGHPMDRGD